MVVRNAEARIVLKRFADWAAEPSRGPFLDPSFFDLARLIVQAREVLGEEEGPLS